MGMYLGPKQDRSPFSQGQVEDMNEEEAGPWIPQQSGA